MIDELEQDPEFFGIRPRIRERAKEGKMIPKSPIACRLERRGDAIMLQTKQDSESDFQDVAELNINETQNSCINTNRPVYIAQIKSIVDIGNQSLKLLFDCPIFEEGIIVEKEFIAKFNPQVSGYYVAMPDGHKLYAQALS